MKINLVDPRISLLDGIDRGLSHFVSELVLDGRNIWRPPMTLIGYEDRFVIECDIPGVSPNDVQLEVRDGILEISGGRKTAELPEGATVQLNERTFSRFLRRVKLDGSVDTSRIEADYRDGVLVVTAPRSEEKLPRRVEIRHGTSANANPE